MGVNKELRKKGVMTAVTHGAAILDMRKHNNHKLVDVVTKVYAE